ncbi:MAG: hypothetical protein ACT4OX_16220 [Actinomycetota bacterium]
MASVVIALTLSVALAKQSVVQILRAVSRRVERIAGALLAAAGGYLIYYWSITLGSDPGERPAAGPARFVENLSYDAAGWLDRYWLKVLIIMLAVIAAVTACRTILRLGTTAEDRHSDASDDDVPMRTG